VSGATRSRLLIGVSAAASALLVIAYLAAGGASYEPAQVRDPCQPREWRSPDTPQEVVEQFTLSALDGAACELHVSRETLARALATLESRQQFARRYRVDDTELEAAVRAGLVRAIDDAEDAKALSPFVAIPLREVAKRLPVDEAIRLINDARPIFEDASGFLGGIEGLLGGAQGLLPDGAEGVIP
jgi:hypothetical protein